MVVKELGFFDAEKIMNSGQIFRMYKVGENLFRVFSKDKCLELMQKGSKVTFGCTEEEFEGYWKHYFDLDRDYSYMVESVLKDDSCNVFLKNSCKYGADIRILNQDIWEMMISFIISQQKQIPSIRKCVEALSEKFGEKRKVIRLRDDAGEVEMSGSEKSDDEEYYYTFPTAAGIASGGPDGLKGLSLGYRERYIYETALAYLERGIRDEELKNMSFADAKKYLCSFCGIGEKVANCILLFGAGFVDAFPKDVHIKDILYREYGDKSVAYDKMKQSDYERLIEEHFGKYAGYRGIVQQWIFAYELIKK